MSIRAIADAVGVTPPSIYRHFADKDALINAVCFRQFAEFDAEMEEAAAEAVDAVDALRRRAHAYVSFAAAKPEQYRILFMATNRGLWTREAFADASLPGVTAFNHLVEAVSRAMEEGAFAPADPFLVATSLWAAVHGYASLCISVPGFPIAGHDAALDHLVDTLARGLAR